MSGSGFMSEDGSSFVSIKEDDGNENVQVDLKDENIDIEKIPEEHRGAFKQLLDELKEKGTALDSLKEKADLTNAIKDLAASSKTNVSDAHKDVVKEADPFESLKFEEGDYYKKFFEPLIAMVKKMDSQIKTLGGEVVNNKKTSWVEKVQTFVKSEGLTKPVIDKMDELARSMGQGVYNDLPRLAKLAKMELGINGNVKEKNDDDIESKRKNVVNFQTKRKGADASKAKVKTMADAWDAAEDKLADAD